MLKHSIAVIAGLAIAGVACAKSGWISCPSNIKSVMNGRTYGPWKATVLRGDNILVKSSTPGLVKTKQNAPGLACYADDTANFMNPNQYRRPLYNVIFYYTGSTCRHPKVVAEKHGFECD